MGDTDLLQPTGTHRGPLPASDADPTSATSGDRSGGPPPDVALVEIAIPVYNEEEVLESSIRRLRTYLDQSFPFSSAIVIVDNASTDGTWDIAMRLCDAL